MGTEIDGGMMAVVAGWPGQPELWGEKVFGCACGALECRRWTGEGDDPVRVRESRWT